MGQLTSRLSASRQQLFQRVHSEGFGHDGAARRRHELIDRVAVHVSRAYGKPGLDASLVHGRMDVRCADPGRQQ